MYIVVYWQSRDSFRPLSYEILMCIMHSTQVRDVVNVTFRRAMPKAEPLQIGSQFWTLRDRVVAGEQDVLRALGFSGAFSPPSHNNHSINHRYHLTLESRKVNAQCLGTL
jgi:hypothetical protein